MDFRFTEDQIAITQAAREMLAESCTPSDLRRLLESGGARDPARWAMIGDMGLIGVLAPEARGGMGLDLPDLIGIAESAGYVGLAEPLIEQAGVVVPLLASLEDDRGWIERVLKGEVIAIGHAINDLVADADSAAALLLADGNDLHLVPRADVTLVREESIDPFRRLFRVEWVPSAATLIAGEWGLTSQRGAVLAAAQLIGVAQRSIDIAVAYAKERAQFGRPIGSYQAVKHLLATAQVKIEFARPVVHAASVELSLGNLSSAARVSHAKIVAGEAADLATRTSLQVHGAMGMTWEVDLHFFIKRAMALKGAWGTGAVHLENVSRRLASLPTGPSATFAAELAHA